MYTKDELHTLLKQVKYGDISIEQAMDKLKDLPYTDLGYAKIDNHRSLRNGFPEVIFCPGKDIAHICGIAKRFADSETAFLATRATQQVYDAVKAICPSAEYHALARIITMGRTDIANPDKKILVVTAGTADIAVAEEAAVTAAMLGNTVERLYDVGVAGVHRLLGNLDTLQSADVIIVAAGMEGALVSVVGGLVDVPVIAVPTSVGYGASFEGLTALLAMLNSCASGVGVVNIDNGFGAAYLAATILQN